MTATPVKPPTRATIASLQWRLTPMQAVFLAATAIVLVAQAAWAVISLGEYGKDRAEFLRQESVLASLTYTQRDSFNLMQKYDRWALGEESSRSVLEARALLAQRLSVRVDGTQQMAQLVSPEFREALAGVDQILVGLPDGDSERVLFWQAKQAVWHDLNRATRDLTVAFGNQLSQESEASAARRARAEGIYLGLVALSLGLISTTMVFIGSDILRRHRRATEELERATEELEGSAQSLILRGRLDGIEQAILAQHSGGISLDGVEELLLGELNSLILTHQIILRDGKIGAANIGDELDEMVSSDLVELIVTKGQEVLDRVKNREARAQLAQQTAQRDPVTGLLSRSAFTQKVREWEKAPAGGPGTALLVALDIDRFGDLNSGLGMEAGDSILRELAERLAGFLGPNEYLSRTAADEFSLFVLDGFAEDVEAFVRKVLAAGSFVTTAGGNESPVTCSGGAVVWNRGEKGTDDAFRELIVALQIAKESENRDPVIYQSSVHDEQSRVWLDDLDIREAHRRGEFVLHFQPIVNLDSGRVVGCEALLRWDRPGLGLVSPGEILPGLERAGLSAEVGLEIIEQGFLAWQRTLAHAGVGSLGYFSVNVDAKQFAESDIADFVGLISTRLDVPATALVVEVTEHVVLTGKRVIDQLERLRNLGARIALDDFGSGFSGLAQLGELPVDIVKLDRRFISGGLEDESHASLVREVTMLSRRLGLEVIAEGIEDQTTAEFLRSFGVTYGQGYLYSRAIPEGEFRALVEGMGRA